jgi:hypothetical protein
LREWGNIVQRKAVRRAGIVLYAGEQQLSFGDRLTALPMAALWTLDGSALLSSSGALCAEVHA